MTRKMEPFRHYNLSGGLNTRDANALLRVEESPDLLNIVLDEKGSVSQRPGTAKYKSVQVEDAPCTSLYEFSQKDGTTFLLAAAGKHLKKETEAGWESLKSDFTEGQHFEFITNTTIDKCLFVNGKNGYFEYDGTNCVEVTPYSPTEDEILEFGLNSIPEDPKFILFHKYRVWLAGTTEYPDRVYFCGQSIEGSVLYDYFPVNYWIRIPNPKGEPVTGMIVYQDRPYIFTRSSIWTVYGDFPDEYHVVKVLDGVGCIAHRSIREVNGRLFFLGMDGIYMFDGTAISRLSHKIPTEFDAVDREKLDRAAAYAMKGNYLLSLPETENNDYHLNFDADIIEEIYREHGYAFNAWTRHKGFEALGWLVTREARVLFASPDGYVREYGVGLNDDGEAIESYIATKDHSFGLPEQLKRVRRMHLMSSGVSELYYRIDFGEWVKFAEVGRRESLVKRIDIVYPDAPLCSFIAFKFVNNQLNETFTIDGYTLHLIARGIRV